MASPEPPRPPARPPSNLRPKQKTSVWLWPALVVVLIGAVFAVYEVTQGASDSSSTSSDYDQRPQDVRITQCEVTRGDLRGAVDVTNHTAQASTYAVKVAFESPDGKIQYDTGTAIINALDPGKASGSQSVEVSKRVGDVPVKCTLAAAARYTD